MIGEVGRLKNGVMVKSIFAKITDAKRFLCFLMIKNTPAERKSPWDNHKSLRSFSSICTSCSSSHSSNTSSAAQTFVVIPGTFPSSWGVFYRLASVIFAKTDLTITPFHISPLSSIIFTSLVYSLTIYILPLSSYSPYKYHFPPHETHGN